MEKVSRVVEKVSTDGAAASDSLLHIEEEVGPGFIKEDIHLIRNKEPVQPEQSEETAAAIHVANTRLVKVSEVLQTSARALQQVIESKVHAEAEAEKWRKKYEQLQKSQVHRTERVVQESVGGQVVRQEKVVTYVPEAEVVVAPVATMTLPVVETVVAPVAQATVTAAARKGLAFQKQLRSKSIPASSTQAYDYRTVVSRPEPPTYGKVSFRLEWLSEGQDIVTFESGNISTPTCSNKQIVLVWESPPQCVCILAKPNCKTVHGLCKEMIWWLSAANLLIYVEPRVRKEMLAEDPLMTFLQTWDTDEELCFLHNKIDLLISLGGDGTVLWAASLFRGPVPPIVAFAMGSLGFMTPFQSDRYKESLLSVMKGPAFITIRHRLHCRIIRHSKAKASPGRDEVHIVLNEVAIDRGMSPFLTNLECYCDNIFVTNVQGDGLILSTPSGSTAYSLSAGGSMVHPQVAAILFTPICPHSLSFRPLILPEHVTLRVQVPLTSRGHAWVSFDGRERVQLGCGDALVVHLSSWPVPTACSVESTNAFIEGVKEGLHWNMRKVQGNKSE